MYNSPHGNLSQKKIALLLPPFHSHPQAMTPPLPQAPNQVRRPFLEEEVILGEVVDRETGEVFAFDSRLPVQDAAIVAEGTTKPRAPKGMGSKDKPPYKFKHLRYFFDVCANDRNQLGIWNCGGATIVYQVYPNRILYSFAICSRNDNFQRKIGRAIGIGRIKDGLYDEIPLVSNDHIGAAFKEHIIPSVYRRANPNGEYQRDFADEIASREVPEDITLALF
jgi:hypothetical protein